MRPLLVVLAVLLGGAGMAQADELPDFDKLWNYAKPDETEKRFRELLPRAEASGDVSYHLQLLTQLARTQGLQKRFEEAHRILDDVEARLTDELKVARVRYLLERGRTFNSGGKKEKAPPLFLEAWKIAREAKADYHAVDAAHMLGIVEPPEKQIEWAEKAMALAEASEDKRAKGWLGALYNNLGWSYFELENYERALEIHKKGLAWREKIGQPKPTLIAKWAVARMLRALERYDEALEMQEELLEQWKALEEEDGFVYEELAENLLAQGKAEAAKPHFVKAWALLKDVGWLKKSEPERYERLRKMAEAE